MLESREEVRSGERIWELDPSTILIIARADRSRGFDTRFEVSTPDEDGEPISETIRSLRITQLDNVTAYDGKTDRKFTKAEEVASFIAEICGLVEKLEQE